MRLRGFAFTVALLVALVGVLIHGGANSWPTLSSSSSLLLGVASRYATLSTGQMRFTPESVMEWLAHGSAGKGGKDTLPPFSLKQLSKLGSEGEVFTSLRRRLIARAQLEARTILGGGDPDNYVHPPASSIGEDEYPYYQFIPIFEGGVTAKTPLAWNAAENDGGCFQANKAALLPSGVDGLYNLSIESSGPSTPGCSDFYLFATLESVALHTVTDAGSVSIPWTLSADASAALRWDLSAKGVRVFRFRGDILAMLLTIIDTALLFEGELTPGIPPEAAARNLDFLSQLRLELACLHN
jgi:hypothetical protein